MLSFHYLLKALFSVTTKTNNKYEKEKYKSLSGNERFRNSTAFLTAV